jgi:hypothetical protein
VFELKHQRFTVDAIIVEGGVLEPFRMRWAESRNIVATQDNSEDAVVLTIGFSRRVERISWK